MIIKEREKKGKRRICNVGFDDETGKEDTHAGFENNSDSNEILIS